MWGKYTCTVENNSIELLHCYSRCLYTYLNASQTNRRRWKLNTPRQNQSIDSVNQSIDSLHGQGLIFNHPFRLRPTTTPETQLSSGMVRTPLKTTKGFSFLPSAIAARMTVNLPLSWPVVHTETDRSPTLDIVVSPGISSHKGVSSILPIQDKGYWWKESHLPHS